jgi:hypothetical protein
VYTQEEVWLTNWKSTSAESLLEKLSYGQGSYGSDMRRRQRLAGVRYTPQRFHSVTITRRNIRGRHAGRLRERA